MRTDAVKKRMQIVLTLAAVIVSVLVIAGGIATVVLLQGSRRDGIPDTEQTEQMEETEEVTESVEEETQEEPKQEEMTNPDTQPDAQPELPPENLSEDVPENVTHDTPDESEVPAYEMPPLDESAVWAFGLYLESGGTMEDAWNYLLEQNLVPEGMTMEDMARLWEQLQPDSIMEPQEQMEEQQEGGMQE